MRDIEAFLVFLVSAAVSGWFFLFVGETENGKAIMNSCEKLGAFHIADRVFECKEKK